MNIDTTITELFNVIKTKKAELELLEKEADKKWKTNCAITIDNNVINIKVSTIPQLMAIVTNILSNQYFSTQAKELLQIDYEDVYQSFPYEEWIDDCKKRKAIIERNERKQQLAQLEERLNAIVSPEQRRQMELAAIQESIKNLT